jgi:hypothetical protein
VRLYGARGRAVANAHRNFRPQGASLRRGRRETVALASVTTADALPPPPIQLSANRKNLGHVLFLEVREPSQ